MITGRVSLPPDFGLPVSAIGLFFGNKEVQAGETSLLAKYSSEVRVYMAFSLFTREVVR